MATLNQIQTLLTALRLDFLLPAIQQSATDPTIDVSDIDQLGTYLETFPDPVVQQGYKQRFAANDTRIQNGLLPLKPSDYISREQSFVQRLRDNGMPAGFYDQPDDLNKLIASGMSPIEFDNRIQQGYKAALNADQATKTALKDLYGITDADLAAYYLDPTRATQAVEAKAKSASTFVQQISAAQVAGQAQTQAGMALTAQQAQELAAQGITQAGARQGFGEIAQQQELYGLTAAERAAGETAISQTEQIGGTFGTNAAAQQRIATRKRRRQAEFESGGGFATTQRGVSGLSTVGQ